MFDLSFSPFYEYLFIFVQIWKYFVYQYSDLTCSINDEKVFGPSWIIGKFKPHSNFEGKIKFITVTYSK